MHIDIILIATSPRNVYMAFHNQFIITTVNPITIAHTSNNILKFTPMHPPK